MNHQHVTLESMCVSEHMENAYAKIIAEEDMEKDYGKKTIIHEGLSLSW